MKDKKNNPNEEKLNKKRLESKDKQKKSNYDKIKELEEELKKTPYNKRTQHHIGLVKAKIALLRKKELSRGKKGSSTGYSVRKTGDGTVILVGFPSVGKSTILNALTNANSPVGSYAFTTLTVIPGVLNYKFAKIQILDVPGIVQGASIGRGRGKEVLSTIMSADLVVFVVDALHPEHYDVIKKEVRNTGIRVNQKKPDVKIVKTAKGGINIGTTVKLTKTAKETLKAVLKEFKINNADVVVRTDITVDQMIDVIEGNKKYIPAIVVVNKIDAVSDDVLEDIKKKLKPDVLMSASKGVGVEELKESIYNSLGLMQIFLKEPGKEADMKEPMIVFKGFTLKDLCLKLHKDFVDKFRFARIWGNSVKFDAQRIVNLRHKLKDKDIIELHIS